MPQGKPEYHFWNRNCAASKTAARFHSVFFAVAIAEVLS
jgi:hypothetical protein